VLSKVDHRIVQTALCKHPIVKLYLCWCKLFVKECDINLLRIRIIVQLLIDYGISTAAEFEINEFIHGLCKSFFLKKIVSQIKTGNNHQHHQYRNTIPYFFCIFWIYCCRSRILKVFYNKERSNAYKETIYRIKVKCA